MDSMVLSHQAAHLMLEKSLYLKVITKHIVTILCSYQDSQRSGAISMAVLLQLSTKNMYKPVSILTCHIHPGCRAMNRKKWTNPVLITCDDRHNTSHLLETGDNLFHVPVPWSSSFFFIIRTHREISHTKNPHELNHLPDLKEICGRKEKKRDDIER